MQNMEGFGEENCMKFHQYSDLTVNQYFTKIKTGKTKSIMLTMSAKIQKYCKNCNNLK